MFDFIDNLFSKKSLWDFYIPITFNGKDWVCVRFLTERQAIQFSSNNGYIYGLRLNKI